MAKLSYDDFKKTMDFKSRVETLAKAADSYKNANGDPTKAIDVNADAVDAVIGFLPDGPQKDILKATNDALRAVGNRGVRYKLEGMRKLNDGLAEALGEAGVPGFPPSSGGDGSFGSGSGTPPAGSEWQPTMDKWGQTRYS